MSRFLTRIAVLLGMATCAMPQDFAFDAYTVYTLKVPDGYKTWVIISDPNGGGAEWCYTNRKDAAKVEEVCTNKVLLERYIYSSGEKVRVLSYDSSVVNVSLGDGRSGWVARDLVEIPKEQLQEYEARQKANVKQLADAKALESKLEAKKASKARAEQAERQAKERAYIATLPKLQGGSNEVLVATSMDCARDYRSIIEFGRKNGTGVEYRKKILELISLGCAVNFPPGTAILVSHRDKDFAEFCAYDGAKRGTCGVALTEQSSKVCSHAERHLAHVPLQPWWEEDFATNWIALRSTLRIRPAS